jgi:hypothetical protein
MFEKEGQKLARRLLRRLGIKAVMSRVFDDDAFARLVEEVVRETPTGQPCSAPEAA